ncbi:MAG: V-type ATP synthase subunit A, partial [Candidatus Ranarchaeia archaeon]
MSDATITGLISRISRSIVEAENMSGSQMHEMVRVGHEQLVGEIIRITGDTVAIQVYENTSGVKPGEPVVGTGNPLVIELGPGLIRNSFDGIQRPLERIRSMSGPFISRGVRVAALSRKTKWHFIPKKRVGEKVSGGDILGTVKESTIIEHRILVPPCIGGKIVEIAAEGDYTVDEGIAKIKFDSSETSLTMIQIWPVRKPRPYRERLLPVTPLVTGQRVIDTFFPITK